MSVIVHNGTEHVEQKRRALRGNKISCRRRSMVGAKAAPLTILDHNQEEYNCSEGDSEGEDHSYLPHEVFALIWHANVGNIMHVVPCIAYCIHQRCHLLSLDMLCVNAICLVSLSYM